MLGRLSDTQGLMVSSSLTVRFVVPGDFVRWLPLWEEYNAFCGCPGATAPGVEITRTTWARFFDVCERMHALVAESDGQLLGFAHYTFHPSTTMIGPVCCLEDLFVAEASRSMGTGRSLIDVTFAQARMAGATRVYWHVREGNLIARKLYDQVAEHPGSIVYRKDI
jgi:GNAT superfamily N-acetyltransferase